MGKKKIVGEVPAEEIEDVAPDGDMADEAVDVPAKVKGAPRARRWNYGIAPSSIISLLDGAKASKGAQAGFEALQDSGSMTVAEFSETVDDWRHQLRVLLRGKAAAITGADGQLYPQEYDHAGVAAAREAKAKAKAAAKAAKAETEETE